MRQEDKQEFGCVNAREWKEYSNSSAPYEPVLTFKPSEHGTSMLLVMRLGLSPAMAGLAKVLRNLRNHLMESLLSDGS